MKDINGQLMKFLHAATAEEDLNEIVYQLRGSNYRSLRLVNLSRTKFMDSDFLFNNQQYKIVVTRKLPPFDSSMFEEEYLEEENEILSDGDDTEFCP